MNRSSVFAALLVLFGVIGLGVAFCHAPSAPSSAPLYSGKTSDTRSNDQWKKILTPEQFLVLREGGTEIPFTSDLLHEKRAGTYVTADCGQPVFRSEDKYDSGTGWPSFTKPISEEAVKYYEDMTLGISRTEVRGSECDSHLGHVFPDGPQPTGKRYCINGIALRFIPDGTKK